MTRTVERSLGPPPLPVITPSTFKVLPNNAAAVSQYLRKSANTPKRMDPVVRSLNATINDLQRLSNSLTEVKNADRKGYVRYSTDKGLHFSPNMNLMDKLGLRDGGFSRSVTSPNDLKLSHPGQKISTQALQLRVNEALSTQKRLLDVHQMPSLLIRSQSTRIPTRRRPVPTPRSDLRNRGQDLAISKAAAAASTAATVREPLFT